MNVRKLSTVIILFFLHIPFPLYSADDSAKYRSYTYHEINNADGSTSIIEYAPNDLPSDVGTENIISMGVGTENIISIDSFDLDKAQKQLFSQDGLDLGVSALVNPWRRTITCNGLDTFSRCASYAGSLDVRIPTWNWTKFELVSPRDGSNTINFTDTSNGLTGVLNLELLYGEHRVLDTCTPMGLGCWQARLYSKVTVRALNQSGAFVARARFERTHRFVGETPNEERICISTEDNDLNRWVCEYKQF